MSVREDRFSMSADKYLAKHNILVYLEDGIAQLLEHKEENPKVNAVKFISAYFSSLRDGNHTMFREYTFIRSTHHNRASFVKLFWKCYKQIGKKGDLLSIQEYHSLLGILCPDFPFSMVQKTARIILIDDALDCLISFSDFIYAFQVQFCFEEFLEKSSIIYQSILQTQRSPRDPVVVPSSASIEIKIHQQNHQPVDGVESVQLFRSLAPLCEGTAFSTPSILSLREILISANRISFYGFLMAVAKSETINEQIGRLPAKNVLLEGGEPDSAPITPVPIRNIPTTKNIKSKSTGTIGRPGLRVCNPPRAKSYGLVKLKSPAESSSDSESETESSDSTN